MQAVHRWSRREWRSLKTNASLPARVVDDFLDNTTNVSVALCVVESAKFGGCLVMVSVCLELAGEKGMSYGVNCS